MKKKEFVTYFRRITVGRLDNVMNQNIVQSFVDNDVTQSMRHEMIVPESISFWQLLGFESRKVKVTIEVLD